MKLKKIAAAAAALMMALSVLTVPAWAAYPADESALDKTTSNNTVGTRTASTEVYVYYSSTSDNISVTVPLWVTPLPWTTKRI